MVVHSGKIDIRADNAALRHPVARKSRDQGAWMGRIEKHSVKAEAPPQGQAGLTLAGVSIGGAVSDISLTAQPGAVLALLGGAYAGKSTLLRLLANGAAPYAGLISHAGADLRRVPAHRRGFGVVAQDDALFPRLTLAQNVAYPLRLREIGRRARAAMVEAALDSVLLTGASRLPHQASAAERQRACIARATVFGPAVLLLDEPLSHQPAEQRPALLAALRRLHLMLGATTILGTRVAADAMALADRLAILDRGRLVQEDAPATLYDRPDSSVAALATGSANLLPGTVHAIDEDGLARIRLTCGPVVEGLAGPNLRVRDRCLFCLRPERLAIAPTDAASMGDGALDATVLEALHLGDTLQLRLLLGAGQEVLASRPAAAGTRGLRAGQGVAIAWQPHHASVFPAAG
jgi:putative spermidine/putrescine transport system ATP-binding protein